MGILDPWREARAGILAQPFVAPDPFVNPGYNLPDHPSAPYRPSINAVNEEVVAATQAAGTPFAPRAPFKYGQDEGEGDGWDGTGNEPTSLYSLTDEELSQQLSSSMDDKHNPENNSALRGVHNMTGGYLSGPKSFARAALSPAAALANAMAGNQLQSLFNEQAVRNQRSDVNKMHNSQQGVPPGYTPGPPVDPNYQSLTPTPVASMPLTPMLTPVEAQRQRDLRDMQMNLAQETYGGGEYSDGGGGFGGYSGGESDNAGNDTGDRGAY